MASRTSLVSTRESGSHEMSAPAMMASRSSQSQSDARMFDNASNISIRDTQLVNVGGDYVTYQLGNFFDTPMDKLRRKAVLEATHESSTVAYAPRCKAGTRKTILGEMVGWISGTNRSSLCVRQRMLWLSGPAGGGKTCIQRELVDRCEELGILAASYFFSTRLARLDESAPFVATIALQLCSSIPDIQSLVVAEIEHDPGIFDKPLEYQLERLICHPLTLLNRWSMRRPWKFSLDSRWYRIVRPRNPNMKVIIVDGIDECKNPQEQVRIIRLFASAIEKRRLPFRVAIAGRPEYEIRSAFDDKGIKSMVRRIRLEDHGCDADIEDYLIDSLFDIRTKHPSSSNLPLDWPSRDQIKLVATKASGQFIYASTFLTFINNPRRDLREMFALAINFPISPGESMVNPFLTLDALYTVIMESTDVDPSLLKQLVHGLMVMSSAKPTSTSLLDKFYCLNGGTTHTVFCDLHSIIDVPPHKSRAMHFHHKSLQDYLQSPVRSGRFHQPLVETHQEILRLCAYHLLGWSSLDHAKRRSGVVFDYASDVWVAHVVYLLENDPEALLAIDELDLASLPETNLKYVCLEKSTWSDEMAHINFCVEDKLKLRAAFHETVCSRKETCYPLCHALLRTCDIVHSFEKLGLNPGLFHCDGKYGNPYRSLTGRMKGLRRIDELLSVPQTEWESVLEPQLHVRLSIHESIPS
ncbi:hypothetical protein FA15DRAFT_757671 [Coprinopsis marcescibilis]|uniref:Nephrocystin 3-like N-terminal domain-containing protein n=1 Tax=Coprinopsis marcescibilis TaxID=230819 RepID=A0A5C3KR51_COPMA|nr:hypothetical protein FA15DRAFT_757671 [Coprinopsis marcescibilis]